METLFMGTAFPALARVVILFSITQIMWFELSPSREDTKEDEAIAQISDCLPLLASSRRLVIQ